MLSPLLRALSALCLSSSLLAAIALPARAAERVTLRYSGLEAGVAVDDLAQLAETGRPSPDLAAYLLLANRQPAELQDILTRVVPIDSNLLSGALNSFAGGFLLNQVDDVVQAPGYDSRDALRTALIGAAEEHNRLTLIEVLQHHPAEEVQIDGDRLARFVRQLQSLQRGLADFGF